MYQLKFKLKQHTPIIHFQHDQDGATLRATEVKPKLDRFLMNKLNGESNVRNTHPDWFISKEHSALNYKIKIISGNQLVSSKIEKGYPNYLGNMGTAVDNKGFVFEEDINISITAKNNELVNTIGNTFSSFLTSTNFGNRSNKGFGCYSLMEINEATFEKEIKEIFKTVYKMTWKNSKVDLLADHKFLFRKIQDEYKLLKAGDSRNKKESKLRLYFNSLPTPIEWEKPYISNDVSKISGSRMKIDFKTQNFHYVRAFLGLADHFEYIKQKVTVHFEPTDSALERFTSPILFKVFDNYLYVMPCLENNLKLIKGKEIKLFYKHFGNLVNDVKDRKLKIPNIDFDVHDFLNAALKNTYWKKL